jgi:hypothetical protein
MLKFSLIFLVLLGAVPSFASDDYEDTPVRCVRPIDAPNVWATASSWAPLTRQFADRTASWISLTPPSEFRGAPACGGLAEGQRQLIQIAFNNQQPGYFVIQALASDRLVVRVRDMFDFPLFEITAEFGDFTGTLVSQTIRLSDGDFKLEFESGARAGHQNGPAAGVIASITNREGVVLVNTSAENSCGRFLTKTK